MNDSESSGGGPFPLPRTGFESETPLSRKVVGFVLAGGQSRRMGRDKAELCHAGKTFSNIALDQIRKAGLEGFVISKDLRSGCGPLGGIETAFSQHPGKVGLFLACDMPLLPIRTIVDLLTTFAARGGCPVATRVSGQLPGFPFVLSPQNVSIVVEQLNKGEYSLQKLFNQVQPSYIEVTASEEFMNVNTPLEYQVISSVKTQ
jgi:molybdopterin-guanine dinucleotide biosynthesis protein A